jgi:mannitol/fructose-specific phosphotransferase system IIA component (Ntr-type)
MSPNESHRLLLGDLLSPATIELHLRAHSKEEVLAELVARVTELATRPNDQETLLHALLEREGLHSTGIGDGIALPHARNALVGLVSQPAIVFGRHTGGIPFGSIDGTPATLFFLLVAPTVSIHLHILARISRLLRQHNLRRELLLVERPERALGLIRESEAKL